jgi:hypothetical protein
MRHIHGEVISLSLALSFFDGSEANEKRRKKINQNQQKKAVKQVF